MAKDKPQKVKITCDDCGDEASVQVRFVNDKDAVLFMCIGCWCSWERRYGQRHDSGRTVDVEGLT